MDWLHWVLIIFLVLMIGFCWCVVIGAYLVNQMDRDAYEEILRNRK